MVEAVRTYEDGKFRKSDFVTVKRNVLADVEVKVSLQTKLGFDETEKEGIIREIRRTLACPETMDAARSSSSFIPGGRDSVMLMGAEWRQGFIDCPLCAGEEASSVNAGNSRFSRFLFAGNCQNKHFVDAGN